MSFRKIKPTKSNLLKLKYHLEFIDKGKNFLEFKKNELIQEIRDAWELYKAKRKDFFNVGGQVFHTLNETYKEQGKWGFNLISQFAELQYSPMVELKYLKKIGIAIPQLDFELEQKESLPPYSFDNTSKNLDELMQLLTEFIKKLLSLAEIEDKLIKYAFNFQKISRRIQGLKNIIKPQIMDDIKKIESILEEVERETFVRLKKTKDMIKNSTK
ncbi:MAG: V-type ATP synthase subunit D [Promethearchaeota archaeon]|nr:MAG: V-type ATP synthase subunit D [Candidatus Lokiarchaeota archaeon]